jgi:DNA replication protein DnaC
MTLTEIERALRDLRLSGIAATLNTRVMQAQASQQPFNRIVEDWGKYLRDATMGTTILDRLMHRAVMLEFEGKSYRLKEAAARIALNTAQAH